MTRQQDEVPIQVAAKKIGNISILRADGIKCEAPKDAPKIHKVPNELLDLNRAAYTPRHFSIGPFHHKRLDQMQDVKLWYARFLFRKLPDTDMAIDRCWAETLTFVEDAKKFYEYLDLDDDHDFAWMLLIDGCFILGLLYISYSKYKAWAMSMKYDANQIPDGPLGNRLTHATLKYDLLMLENQLPFFVLDNLFKQTLALIPDSGRDSSGCSLPLSKYVLLFFGDVISFEPSHVRESEDTEEETYHHILHLLHKHCCPHKLRSSPHQSSVDIDSKIPETSGSKEASYQSILSALRVRKKEFFEFKPTATDLDNEGVKFIPCPGPGPLNICFSKAHGVFKWFRRDRFEIPKLQIDDSTELVFRNLIAFEQCCPGVSQHITSYACLMDTLISTEKDVLVLQKANMINNCLGSNEEVSNLFNKLCKEIVGANEHFEEPYKEAAKYSKRLWPRYMAYVKRTYFDSPWTFIAFCGGFIAFAMSVVQFIRNMRK